MFNTIVTIGCVLASIWVVTMIVLLIRDIWTSRGEWKDDDEL